jgi:heme/copper-type cytochrome/quinol oxidase subunit 1
MAQYQAVPPPPAAQDPGRTLGIVGLILAFFCSLIGMIISIVAYRQSAQAGYKNNIALAGIIVGAVLLVLGIILQVTGVLTGLISGSR